MFIFCKKTKFANTYLWRNLHLFLMIMPWSYFKYSYLFYTLNVYKIPAKEHQLVLRWIADKISVLKTLFCKYLKYVPLTLLHFKELKTGKILRLNFFSFFERPIKRINNCREINRICWWGFQLLSNLLLQAPKIFTLSNDKSITKMTIVKYYMKSSWALQEFRKVLRTCY